MDRKTMIEVGSIVAYGAVLLYLQAAVFSMLRLPTADLLTPTWLTNNVLSMGDVGLAIAALLALWLGWAEIPRLLKQPSKATKFLVGGVGIVIFASGVKILASGSLISLEAGVGAVFALVGLNMAARLVNRKLF
jgi:hypothetical protein